MYVWSELQTYSWRMDVAVTELRAHLGRFIDAARDGDDVVITEFVKSGGQETLPTYMLGQLRRSVTPEVNAVSTVFLALSIVVVTIFFLSSRRRA